MTSRRRFIVSSAAVAAITTLPGSRFPACAANRPFVFVSWGGALSDAEKRAFMDPFSQQHGTEVINTSPTEYAKLKAMVASGNVEWDLVTVGGRFVFEGEEVLAALDYQKIPNAGALEEGWKAEKGIATSTGATIIAWNTKTFPDGNTPQSWVDFWDVKRFPGPRGLYKPFYYNYEAALLAAGLKREEIYPVTDERVEMAIGKLKELKPNVQVWWSSGAQPPQLLSSGELALSSAWSGRMIAIEAEQAPTGFTFNDGIAWANWMVVPKGSPNTDLAMAVINYALSEEAQTKLLDLGIYGPVVGSVTEKATPEQRKNLVMTPENIKTMLVLDEKQAALYSSKYQERWNEFQLG
ncbi:MAG TPA: ABC transporter substrate-binding protein [Alphaproteobacteria bacterium]|nr:ABC transporter substrate-binding protein [Alphaproteobacteria bacterium]